jgi:hypothetical protein
MAESLAELDARIERLASAQAFAEQHRDWKRDAELGAELEKWRRIREERVLATWRGLTLMQPWASAVMLLGKDVENRPTRCPAELVGKRIAVHAGLEVDETALEYLSRFRHRRGWRELGQLPRGVILGSVQLVGCISEAPDGTVAGNAAPYDWPCLLEALKSWWRQPDARWQWALREPQVLAEPVPCRGQQGLWRVPVEAARKLETRHV